MKFNVGDLVYHRYDGDEGPITETSGSIYEVDFEKDGLTWVEESEISLVSEDSGVSSFEDNVRRILNGVADTIVAKNESYGDSALNPIRVFSKADRIEQLNIRLDDKLSRVQRGSEYPGDDTLRDIIGYVTLMLIARESQ